MTGIRDHGGGIDAAAARHGGARSEWLDLSTGINPVPYPIPQLPDGAWRDLPDSGATEALERAARAFWSLPDDCRVIAVPGASAAIAALPRFLGPAGTVEIPGPTYNEHAAAFRTAGWTFDKDAQVRVLVHPNNPDGRLWSAEDLGHEITIIDESFADTLDNGRLDHLASRPGIIILKSFGKFWGLAGLRLGFVIGHPDTLSGFEEMLGPWPVSGPALAIGRSALVDLDWSAATRARLQIDASRLDNVIEELDAEVVGGTPLFRTYAVDDPTVWRDRLARHRIWTRVFPYSDTWIRFGLPGNERGWSRLLRALKE